MNFTHEESETLFLLSKTVMPDLSFVHRVLNVNEGYENLVKTKIETFEKSSLFSTEELKKLERLLKDVNYIREYEEMINRNIHMSFYLSDDYPDKLKNIPSPPPFLFYYGKLPDSSLPSLAVIGTRQCSFYGEEAASRIGELCAINKIQLISGMARGIDSFSQKACLHANGHTYAVLGGGVDICYPKESRGLYEALKTSGGLISEHVPGTNTMPQYFAFRNRIISGLSDAVLVVEAKEKSGTLITVDQAIHQGREVYVIPGRIFDVTSSGCNRLIRQGATIVNNLKDFFEDFIKATNPDFNGTAKRSTVNKIKLSPEEKLIMDVICEDAFTLDELTGRIPLNSESILIACINLSSYGLLFNMGGCRFRKTYK